MEATTDFHHKVHCSVKILSLESTINVCLLIGYCCFFNLCLDDTIIRSQIWSTTTWRSTRRWTSKWLRLKPSWSPSNWRRCAISQVSTTRALYFIQEMGFHPTGEHWRSERGLEVSKVWCFLFSVAATVFSCLAIALGVYRLWRWMSCIHPQRQIVLLTTADRQAHQGLISNAASKYFPLDDTQSALFLNTYSAPLHFNDKRFYLSF